MTEDLKCFQISNTLYFRIAYIFSKRLCSMYTNQCFSETEQKHLIYLEFSLQSGSRVG